MSETYHLRLFQHAIDVQDCGGERHDCASDADAFGRACELLRRTRGVVAVEVWRGDSRLFRIGDARQISADRLDATYADRCARAWSRSGRS